MALWGPRLGGGHRRELAGIERAHIFLHAPWIVSKTRSVRADFPEPTLLTEAALASVIREAEKGITENFRAAHREIAEAVRAVEKKITEYRVNGYGVSSAVGQKAQTLELTLLESFAPENAVARFAASLTSLTSAPLEWHGAAAACAGARAALAHGEGDMLTLSAGGEATEVCITRRGVLHEVVSLPLGLHTAARAVWEEGAAHSVTAAEALLRAASASALADSRRTEAEAARARQAERFRRAVSDALAPKISAGFLPRQSLLLADESNLSFYSRAFGEPLPTEVSVRGAEAFAPTVQFFREAGRDTFFAGEAAFIALYTKF